MSRLSTGAFGALVLATLAAFFVTQHLKVSTPVINANIAHPEPFSPTPQSCRQTTRTSFYLQHRADDVDVYVIDASRTIVRTIAVDRHMRKGVRYPDGVFVWNGREDDGRLAPDGTYYFRVGLRNQGRSVDLTGYPIVLRTVPPHPVVDRVAPTVLPNGTEPARIRFKGNEGRRAAVRPYRTDLSPANPMAVKTFGAARSPARWDGRIGGRPAPPGIYLVGLKVTDRACNTGLFPAHFPPAPGSTPHAGVTVRYLAAQPPLHPTPAGSRALVLVDSRHKPYEWALRRAGSPKMLLHGTGGAYQLSVPVPRGSAGLYVLAIRTGPYRTSVPLIANAPARRHNGILVVLPALTWQGQNPVDDDGDGFPDTLDSGGPIALRRVLADGLPNGFGDLATLLSYLDRARLGYELTSDVGLIDGVGPGLAGHSGVVLAGTERWLPSSLGSALSAYVNRGGRVLSLGIDSLRRGVSLQGGEASHPTAPMTTDVFGARPGAVVAHSGGEVLVIRDDLGIFSGTSRAFPGFSSYETITPPLSASPQLSLAGVSSSAPSIVGYRLGRGMVVEIGLPGFGAGVARSVDAQELVGRLWAVLSR